MENSKEQIIVPVGNNGGEWLFHRWRQKAFHGWNWFRLYGFMFIGLIAIFISILLLINHNADPSGFLVSKTGISMIISLYVLALVVKVQLAILPAMVSIEDISFEKMQILCSTAITPLEIFRSISKVSLIFCLGLIFFVFLIEYYWIMWLSEIIDDKTLHVLPVVQDKFNTQMVIALIFYSAMMAGLSIALSVRYKTRLAAIMGALLPLTLFFLSGITSDIIVWNVEERPEFISQIMDVTFPLGLPEGYIFELAVRGKVTAPSGDDFTVGSILFIYIIGAITAWSLAWWSVVSLFKSSSRRHF